MIPRPGKLLLPSLAAAAMTLAACGGSSSSTTTHSAAAARPTRLYTVALTGRAEVQKGAPSGRGVAIIAFHGQATLCWRFAHLHGFTDATVARIHKGAAGRAGPVAVPLTQGPRLHHNGCTKISPAVTSAIWGNPSAYYVNVHSAAYPNGAVRGQL